MSLGQGKGQRSPSLASVYRAAAGSLSAGLAHHPHSTAPTLEVDPSPFNSSHAHLQQDSLTLLQQQTPLPSSPGGIKPPPPRPCLQGSASCMCVTGPLTFSLCQEHGQKQGQQGPWHPQQHGELSRVWGAGREPRVSRARAQPARALPASCVPARLPLRAAFHTF